MSNHHRHLPPETLDYIVDLLHDEQETLERCCLISKSWIPRTRKHLFADIKFFNVWDLEAWKKTFPDPTNSPAYHTRTLLVGCSLDVTAEDAEDGGWIQAFSRVVWLELDAGSMSIGINDFSLAPFRRFSSSLESLRVGLLHIPHLQVFNLIRFLPLLKDLAMIGFEPDGPTAIAPSTSPALTGTLELHLLHGMANTARQLLDLPNGLHFRKLELSWCDEEDARWMEELVVACSSTLEHLDIACKMNGVVYSIPPLD